MRISREITRCSGKHARHGHQGTIHGVGRVNRASTLVDPLDIHAQPPLSRQMDEASIELCPL